MGTTTRARRRAGLSVCVLIAAVSLAGCGEHGDVTGVARGAAPQRVEGAGGTAAPNEAAALRELTRAAALAMGDAGLRQEIGREMRDHGVTREHKLELRRFVEGTTGAALLAKMTERAGLTRDSVGRLIAAVRPLEFYMPARAHRQRWRGEAVFVASQLRESDPIIGFDEDGHSVALGTTPPVTPTFALVPVETDFASARVPSRNFAVPSEAGARAPTIRPSTHVASSAAHRNLISLCDPTTMLCDPSGADSGGGSPQTIPSNAPTGLYLTFADFYDVKEPWIKGDPEIEAYVLGPGLADPNTQLRALHCSGQTQPGWYYFDQNQDDWYGSVLLYTQADMLANNFSMQASDARQFAVVMYEDDYQPCVIHDDGSELMSSISWAAAWAYKTFGLLGDCQSVVCAAVVFLMYVPEVVQWTWSSALTNDDFLGLAIDRRYVPAYNNIYATHALMDGTTLNGGIALQWHIYGQ